MAAFARRERADLTDLLDAVGPDAPTLCAGWSTYDLTAHLVLREGNPLAAAGGAVPAMEGLVDRGMARLKTRHPYPELVERLRQGPPRVSPMRLPKVDEAANAMEFFIHHEDVRRAGATEGPRELDPRDQRLLWSNISRMGRMLTRHARVGIELARSDGPQTARISKGEPTAVVRGLPGELALYAFGRGAVADVELSGDEAAVAALSDARLGL